jgi:hypothetical protein
MTLTRIFRTFSRVAFYDLPNLIKIGQNKVTTVQDQGGQIERISPYWATTYLFWAFSEIYRSSPNLWPTFFHGKKFWLNLKKNWAGLHFGQFFQTHLVTLQLTCKTDLKKSEKVYDLKCLAVLTI